MNNLSEQQGRRMLGDVAACRNSVMRPYHQPRAKEGLESLDHGGLQLPQKDATWNDAHKGQELRGVNAFQAPRPVHHRDGEQAS